jgi:hypothetical protein
MADADEDLIFHPSSSSHDPAVQVENDLSDETQDFRFLNNLSLYVQVDFFSLLFPFLQLAHDSIY